MIKKLIKYLLTLKPKKMSKNKDKKIETNEEVKTTVTNEEQEQANERHAEEMFHSEKMFENDIDPEKFSLDMMNAFISSTENLKVIKKQFNFDKEHFVSANIEENERLLKIIDLMKPQQ